MNRLSKILGNILAANSTVACDADEIRYGLELFLGSVFQILLQITVGWWLGILKELLMVLFSSALLRRYAGGIHCTAYYRCTITGLISFPLLAYCCRYIHESSFPGGFLLVAIFSSTIIYLMAPQATIVKPIEDSDMRRLKMQSFIILWLFLLFSVILFKLGQVILATAILLGLSWQSFTMTCWGVWYIRFFDMVLGGWLTNRMGKEEC